MRRDADYLPHLGGDGVVLIDVGRVAELIGSGSEQLCWGTEFMCTQHGS